MLHIAEQRLQVRYGVIFGMQRSEQSTNRLFVIHGAFEIPHVKDELGGGRHVALAKDISAFWKDQVGLHDNVKPIAEKDGIYVVATRAGRGFMPWYVGMASKSFKQEVFTPDKRNDMNTLLKRQKNGSRGTLVLFFLTHADPKKTNIPRRYLHRMEKDLTVWAFKKNEKLLNMKNVQDHSEWHLEGISGKPGRPAAITTAFVKMIGMPPKQ